MFKQVQVAFVTAALVAAPLVVGIAGPAEAAGKYYANCDSLHRDYRHGVAKSAGAAAKQVRDGYGRPAYGKQARAVYATNSSRLDRDKDGTACEA
ncbi:MULTISPECIES: excalibur calcium-binding domain-containing protein [unclassified Nocardioides]|uniref:excalibur calcium-binding domain-containing protein n=1 Tax=unclassified Nocardioides TaxID=2615069 RepID=UPI0000571AEF|nr:MULTISPECIES: excalibur calcium-binding domain-containing protein [unclassified Nocardioides]ABL82844.1 Excalibur domain protein [Nocardioides sp. JS614]